MSVSPAAIVALEDRAWIYPLKVRAIPFLFTFAYLPQVALLAIFNGRNAWLSALFLVLSEGAAISALIFEAFFVDDTLVRVFDATLIARGEEDLVSPYRQLEAFSYSSLDDEGHELVRDPVLRLGKPLGNDTEYSPFSFGQIFIYIISLPISLIPILGPYLFLLANGKRAGALQHHRYFLFRNFSKKERRSFVNQRSWRYRSFGAMALALQLVPVLSMFFLLTSAAGSAIWAADIEKRRRIEDEFAPLIGTSSPN
ncbi:hypothetical protein KEM54_001022 [Ascosphaera aggregata]|nr:hypothetical protein KEM54_001022 [Ascosphaera aggregata]